jgi:DNA-directed RNA polymerase III subunit RPC7
LRSLLDGSNTGDAPNKKRKTLQVATTATAASKIDNYMAMQGQRLRDVEERGGDDIDEDYDDEDEEEDEEKPDAVDEEDNWSAVSSDSEESGDDYNAERYFDNGDDDDMDDGDPYENSYE